MIVSFQRLIDVTIALVKVAKTIQKNKTVGGNLWVGTEMPIAYREATVSGEDTEVRLLRRGVFRGARP